MVIQARSQSQRGYRLARRGQNSFTMFNTCHIGTYRRTLILTILMFPFILRQPHTRVDVTLLTALRSRFVHPLPPLAGLLSLKVGLLVLFGWAVNSTELKSLAPGLIPMMPNAAIAFVCMGISLLAASARTHRQHVRFMAGGAATAAAIIGLATCLEYLLMVDLGFDQWVLFEPLETVGSSIPGRMGINTAICFLIVGLALALKILAPGRLEAMSDGFSLGATFLAFLAFLGYLYQERFLYGVGPYTPMALHTALTLMLVGAGVLALEPAKGFMAVINSRQAGGYMLRRMLPVVFVILPAIGWIQLYGERKGWYGTDMGVAIFATTATVTLAALLWETARRMNEADQARRQSDRLFAAFMTHLPALAWIKDLQGRYLYFNDAFTQAFGVRLEEWRKKTDYELLPDHTAAQFQANDAQVRATAKAVTAVETAPYKDGVHQSLVSKFPIVDEEGNLALIGGVAVDITERNKIESALRETEEQFRQVTEHIQEVFWLSDTAKNSVLYVSPGYESIWGRSCESLYCSPRSWLEAVHPDDRQRVFEAALAKQMTATYDEEYRIIRPDGSMRWIRDRAFPIHDSSGSVCRIAGIADDITQRKRAEEALQRAHHELERRVAERTAALRASQERLEMAFHGAGLASWDWQIDTGAVSFNDRWAQLRGFAVHELLPHVSSPLNGIHAEDRSMVEMNLNACLRGETPEFEAEMRVQTRANEWTWILSRGRVIERSAVGAAVRMAGIEIDMTARKRTEEALRESEARYSSLVSQAADIIYTAGIDGRFTFVNAAACAIMGYEEQELLGKHYLELIREDARDRAQQFYKDQLLAQVPSTYYEFPAMTKMAEEVWFGQHVRLRLVEGQLVGVEAIARDITARKMAEQALQERAKCAAFAAEVSLLLNHDEPLDRLLQRCTDAAVEHLGAAFTRVWLLKPGDLCGDCYKASSCLDRTTCLHLHASSGLSTNLNGEYRRVPLGALKIGRIAQGDGALFTNDVLHDDRLPNKDWMREHGLHAFAGFALMVEGRVFGVLGLFSCEIISEPIRQTLESVCNGLAASIARKQAVAALQASETRTRAIVESALDAVVTMDERGIITGWNSQAAAIFGYQEREISGRLLSDTILPPRYREAHSNGLQRFLSSGQGRILNRRVELSALHKDGSEFPIELSVTALTIEGRKVFSAFLRDIRERKQAERALKEAYDQLRDLTGRLTEAEEIERRRLARELHDEFGQALTGLKFDVAWLTKEMSRVNKVPDAAGIKAKTMGMSHAIDGLIKSVRATAASLRPGVLDDLGLVAALEWLAGSFHERTGLPCDLMIDSSARDLPTDLTLATTVFRGAQELLTNVMRHAQASKASIRLTAGEGQMVLTIGDDGRGFTLDQWKQGRSLGLRGLQERVQLVGGSVSIVSSPGAGTKVTLALPMKSDPVPVAKEERH
jgi:PAS domain S-box-containing protein